jgi:chromosome partitioning protein
MARTISVANQKGGVGKTTTVVNLAVSLAEMQKRTLVVDLDPQGALSVGLGVDSYGLEETIYTAMTQPDTPVERILYPVRDRLDLIPANIDLASAEMDLIGEMQREFILRGVLDPIQARYEFIFIDCPPSLGLLTVNALCASLEVLVPLQCEYFAMRGMRLLLESIEKVKARLNPHLALTGILATMYATGTIHAREVLEEIRAVFGQKVFEVVIYRSIRFAEASVASQGIVEYTRDHKASQAYRELARIILGTAPAR